MSTTRSTFRDHQEQEHALDYSIYNDRLIRAILNSPYYHGIMKQTSSNSKLREAGEGSYLLRYSQKEKDFVVSFYAIGSAPKRLNLRNIYLRQARNTAKAKFSLNDNEWDLLSTVFAHIARQFSENHAEIAIIAPQAQVANTNPRPRSDGVATSISAAAGLLADMAKTAASTLVDMMSAEVESSAAPAAAPHTAPTVSSKSTSLSFFKERSPEGKTSVGMALKR